MVVGAVFGGIGKAAFLAADVHVVSKAVPTAIPQGSSVIKQWGLKGLNAVNNMVQSTKVNKLRELTRPADMVLMGNMLVGKKLQI
ncbi:hypothetical protein F895_02017 [Acinetobacter sp. CIP 64.2]|nr:hypothetical protein F895_02017 [Acinetobacter sp. CIP 64.2]